MTLETRGQKAPLYCSFCGKSDHEVWTLIRGPAVCICDDCIELCVWFIAGRSLTIASVTIPGIVEYESWF